MLAVLLAAAQGCKEEGRRGLAPSRPATSTVEVNVSEKVPKRGKAGKGTDRSERSSPKPRPRLGPELEPSDKRAAAELMVQLRREARDSGHLIAHLPKHVIDLGEGQSSVIPFRFRHSMVQQLEELAGRFIDHARQHANDEAAAIGHILTAVHQAVERNDLSALNAEGGPHTWARRYIRPDEGFVGGGYLPIEDKTGRLLKGGTQSIVGGFRHLTEVLTFAIKSCREHDSYLDAFTEIVAASMAHNFPSLPSLSGEPDKQKRCRSIEGRIERQLRSLGEKWRAVEDPESAAQEIARALIEVEFRVSGKGDEEIRKAFAFLDTH
ncbi:hypothetical protein WMF18_28910 [Sorangium sp. So ce315]|uniref:hypothetical protein n=1 Tax=Sorangium sp. So ce315 TaxID=3133299 RepID=UPI003F603480